MHDDETCPCEQAAWLISDCAGTRRSMYFEAHVTDDDMSPNGHGWYFSSYERAVDGTWTEYDGGMYWDYESAKQLEDVIGETVPFESFAAEPIDYQEFERAVFSDNRPLARRAQDARDSCAQSKRSGDRDTREPKHQEETRKR